MFLLPNLIPIKEGETLLSFVLKNHRINSGTFLDFCQHYFDPAEFFNTPSRLQRVRETEFSTCCLLGGISRQLDISVPILFSKHSPIAMRFPLFPVSRQIRIINTILHSYSGTPLSSPSGWCRAVIRYCPECAKRDYLKQGHFNLYQNHQIPAVKCCPEHGCQLHMLPNPPDLFSFPPDTLTIPAASSEIAFSRFCSSLLKKPNCMECLLICLGNFLRKAERTGRDFFPSLSAWVSEGFPVKPRPDSLKRTLDQWVKFKLYCSEDLLLRVLWFFESQFGFPVTESCSNLYQTFFETWISDMKLVLPEEWSLHRADPYLSEIYNEKSGRTLRVSPPQILCGWPVPDPDSSFDAGVQNLITTLTDTEYELEDYSPSSDIVQLRYTLTDSTYSCYFRYFTEARIWSFLEKGLSCLEEMDL